MKVQKEVIAFVSLVFLLLGALFGVQIMSFIFGNVDQSITTTFADETGSFVNRTGAFINTTTYTIPEASNSNFVGGFTVVSATNSSSGAVIGLGNLTIDASAGTITNATSTVWPAVNLTYTWKFKGSSEVIANSIGNNSLTSLQTYSSQANTQMNTVGITITLLIFLALFAIFWKLFVGGKKKGEKNGSFA